MADQPPPYPGKNEKGEYPPQQGYPPQQPGYPPQQGYPPQTGYQSQPQPQPSAYPPPPQAAYPPPAQPTTVVVQPSMGPIVMSMGSAPMRTMCPGCRADVVTAIHYENGTLPWLLCILLCVFGCNLGCCLIPFCVEGCQDVVHTCPNCRQMIGRWNRM